MEENNHRYGNQTLLKEYLAIQKEMAQRVFGGKGNNKRVVDVYKHLKEINEKKGGIASAELAAFEKDSKYITSKISTIASGQQGEKMAFKSLETIRIRNFVLRNVALSFDGHTTEIDAVVLTKYGATIVEVKNTKRDVIISESGQLKRKKENGQYATDCNLGLKMNDKEFVLRKALERSDYGRVPIRSVVVFTNSDIKVDNQNRYIKTCKLANLPKYLSLGSGYYDTNYSVDELQHMRATIDSLRDQRVYGDAEKLAEIRANFNALKDKLDSASALTVFFAKVKKFFGGGKKVAAKAA